MKNAGGGRGGKTELDPSVGAEKGPVFAARPARPSVLVLAFGVVLAGGTIKLLAFWLTSGLVSVAIAGTAVTLLLCGPLLWKLGRLGRVEWARWRTPDTLTLDSHGLAVRYQGTACRVPWRDIRRIDGRGTGGESGRVRVWTVAPVFPRRFRGKDEAAVLMSFGETFPRAAIADAAAQFAPQGVSVRIRE
ncbi:hypothetical protein [Nocardia altamirensis]|uniref:hypothetical protein n=1 Tax=Nocardia altamirensis TaxID=472158 RepID=UPI00083FEAB6|nr:hypothetical protein [Nocardia altamirensis]